mgnify:CR=1 FL=1
MKKNYVINNNAQYGWRKKCYKKSRINCYSTEDMDYLIFLVLKLSIHRVQDIFHNHLLFL